MPFIMGALALLGAVYFFVIRARNAAEMAGELMDVAKDVQLAARRFGFKRKHQQHPVDSIDDPDIALASIGYAFIALDDVPSREDYDKLGGALRIERRIDDEGAQELSVLARWMVEQCNGASPAVPRLARKLNKMKGAEGFDALMAVIKRIAPENGLSDRQRSALEDVKVAFRIR